jgi:hypothetical protein
MHTNQGFFMKRGFTIIIMVIFIISIVYAVDTIFKEYNTDPDGGTNRITITFETMSETGVAVFWIMRSVDDRMFIKIAEIKPHGVDNKYEYIDKDVYKTEQTFFYKIRARRQDGSIIEETPSMFATPTVSGGINQTWGAIKSMFNK